MATPPRTPATPPKAAPPPPAPPSQGIPSKPTPEPGMSVNIHGAAQGPRPNMAPIADDSQMNDATKAEMEAGREALKNYTNRTDAEMAYGKRMVEKKGGGKPAASPPQSD